LYLTVSIYRGVAADQDIKRIDGKPPYKRCLNGVADPAHT